MLREVRPSVFAELWLAHAEGEGWCGPRTLADYGYKLGHFLASGLPDDISQLDEIHLLNWTRQMRAAGFKPGAIRSYQRPVWTWLRWCYARRYIERDLAHLVRTQRVLPADIQRRTATDETRQSLIEAALAQAEAPYRNAALVQLGWSGGFRRSDFASMRMQEGWIDLEAGWLRVVGKGRKERIAGLDTPGVLALETFLQLERGFQVGPLFMARDGTALSANAVKMVYQRLATKAKVKVSSHDMRRAYSNRLLDAGVSLQAVQDMLGHSHASTTLDYAHEGRALRAVREYREYDRNIRPVPLRRDDDRPAWLGGRILPVNQRRRA